jgi:CHASE2 domain-containing sensor protein
MANTSQKRSLDWKERMLEGRCEERKAVPPGVWAALRWIGLAGLWVFLVVLGRYSTHHPFSSVATLYILAAATAAAMVAAKWLPPPR